MDVGWDAARDTLHRCESVRRESRRAAHPTGCVAPCIADVRPLGPQDIIALAACVAFVVAVVASALWLGSAQARAFFGVPE